MALTVHLVESLILDKRECIGMAADEWGGGVFVTLSKLEVLLLLVRYRDTVEDLDLKWKCWRISLKGGVLLRKKDCLFGNVLGCGFILSLRSHFPEYNNHSIRILCYDSRWQTFVGKEDTSIGKR
jgi:hypothetical protein